MSSRINRSIDVPLQQGDRVAAIDVGSHSVRLLCATFDGEAFSGEKQLTITRLGEGARESGLLSEGAMARTVEAVRSYVEVAKAYGARLPIPCYATAAARNAKNGAAFLALLHHIDDLAPCILDGDSEAMIAYRGAAQPGAVVMDIGGGSTELSTVANGQFISHSVPLGCVWLWEQLEQEHGACGPLGAMAMLDEGVHLARELCLRVLNDAKAKVLVGVGGTATQLAMLDLGLPAYDAAAVQGHALTLRRLDELQDSLLKRTHEQRCAMPGMDPQRADVIVSGCMIALVMMRASGAQTLMVSELDGLDGFLAQRYLDEE